MLTMQELFIYNVLQIIQLQLINFRSFSCLKSNAAVPSGIDSS